MTRPHLELKTILGAMALGLGIVSRDAWQAATGNADNLAKDVTFHMSALRHKTVTLAVGQGFAAKHASIVRFFESLVKLPGGKWKIHMEQAQVVDRCDVSGAKKVPVKRPETTFKLEKLSDVSAFIRHIRLTVKNGLKMSK